MKHTSADWPHPSELNTMPTSFKERLMGYDLHGALGIQKNAFHMIEDKH